MDFSHSLYIVLSQHNKELIIILVSMLAWGNIVSFENTTFNLQDLVSVEVVLQINTTLGQISKNFQSKIVFIFLSISLNMCFGCLKELSY